MARHFTKRIQHRGPSGAAWVRDAVVAKPTQMDTPERATRSRPVETLVDPVRILHVEMSDIGVTRCALPHHAVRPDVAGG